MTKSDHLALRDRFTPASPKIIFVLESPPASGRYFYNPDGPIREPLFRAMMKDVLEIAPQSKQEGLAAFAARGYLIIDATYTPVNNLDDDEADGIIARDFPELVEDLKAHAKSSDTGIVLVKANICDLEPKLKDAGFNVLNGGVRIPFPGTGNQSRFRTAIRQVLSLSDRPPENSLSSLRVGKTWKRCSVGSAGTIPPPFRIDPVQPILAWQVPT